MKPKKDKLGICPLCDKKGILTTHHHPSKHYCKYYDKNIKSLKKVTIDICQNCHDKLHHGGKDKAIFRRKLRVFLASLSHNYHKIQ